MNLKELINYTKNISLAYPTVKEFGEGDIYEFMNSGEHKYPTIFLTIESITSDEYAQTLNATLFYVDRLLSNSSNKIDVQTVGLTTLKSIKEKLEEANHINFTSVNYTPFTEKFSDLCAGVFAQCNIQVNDTLECDDYELGTLTITENGLYNILGYSQVLVDVKGGGEGGSKDPNSIGAYDGMTKINDYLYSISYSNIDYAAAIEHFEYLTGESEGACSFIRQGNKIGRNFDWTINNQVEFLVKTPNTGKHYSVTGIATVAGITTDNINEYSEEFKYLPFRLVDGINERGLVCSVNQLPQSDKTIAKTGTTPTEDTDDTVSMFMLTRYILDNFDNALDAVEFIQKHIKVMPILDNSVNALDFHYCVADKNQTIYLYFEGNETKYEVKSNDKFVMTNFRLAGTSLVDGHYSVTDSNIEEFGQGIERANSLIDNFNLDTVSFTKAYTTTDRLTDFAGIEGATISDTDKLSEIQGRASVKFASEKEAGTLRNSGLWQTVHSVEYDLNNCSIIIKSQELDYIKEQKFGEEILTFNGYIHKNTGDFTSYAPFYSTDFISIENVKSINVKSTHMTANGSMSFYDANQAFLRSTQDFNLEHYTDEISLANGAKYFRICCRDTDRAGFSIILGYESRVSIEIKGKEDVQAEVDTYDYEKISTISASGSLLGLGASFMDAYLQQVQDKRNTWLNTCCNKLGIAEINDAKGGTNICYHANRLYDGSILGTGTAPISSVSAVIIMHTHNKDVFTLPAQYEAYTVYDYEHSGILPFATTAGSKQDDVIYAIAFDYVIKKIKQIYYNYKTSIQYTPEVSALMKSANFPKPCQIVLCTHWHDARVKYNTSVRKLAKKWGLPLVRFDDKIGFTKDIPNPITGCQASIEYTGNVGGLAPLEVIDGVTYGWHLRTGTSTVPIQRKLAAIAERYFEVI